MNRLNPSKAHRILPGLVVHRFSPLLEQRRQAEAKKRCRAILKRTMSQWRKQQAKDAKLRKWLKSLPRNKRFNLAMAISAMSLDEGQCRSTHDLMCFLSAAGLPISRQALQDIEHRALRKCRRTGLAKMAKEYLTR